MIFGMDFNSFIHVVTTMISAKSKEDYWTATGFFYHELAEPGGQELRTLIYMLIIPLQLGIYGGAKQL
jgi:hypothetical protein